MIGEKTSLGPELRDVPEKVTGELLLPLGGRSDTLIAGIADRMDEDGRPAVVLYWPAVFDASADRARIAPHERLLGALLQAFYTFRSDRQLVERIEFDVSFRWFVGLGVDEPVWDASTFSKNRGRLLPGEIVAKVLANALAQSG